MSPALTGKKKFGELDGTMPLSEVYARLTFAPHADECDEAYKSYASQDIP